MSTGYIMTDRMKELNEAAYPLEEQLESARIAANRVGRYESYEREEVRRIRKELAIIDSEMRSISLVVNKAWHERGRIYNTQKGSLTPKEIKRINAIFEASGVSIKGDMVAR